VSVVSTGGGLLGELCPGGSMMSGRQDGLAVSTGEGLLGELLFLAKKFQ
jgi:hypothetical protein